MSIVKLMNDLSFCPAGSLTAYCFNALAIFFKIIRFQRRSASSIFPPAVQLSGVLHGILLLFRFPYNINKPPCLWRRVRLFIFNA